MSAVVSKCGQYRYMLRRGTPSGVAFVLLNPSTADHTREDPTTRRLMAFAAFWGFGGYDLFNVGAGRATKPSDWLKMPDPFGPDNEFYLQLAAGYSTLVVAWGNNAPPEVARATALRLGAGRRMLYCLGVNANGSPKHPLYVKGDTPLRPWHLDKNAN